MFSRELRLSKQKQVDVTVMLQILTPILDSNLRFYPLPKNFQLWVSIKIEYLNIKSVPRLKIRGENPKYQIFIKH